MEYTVSRSGSLIGENRVEIYTRGMGPPPPDSTAMFVIKPERVPDKYHKNSVLTVTVKSGENQINFDLPANPEASEPNWESETSIPDSHTGNNCLMPSNNVGTISHRGCCFVMMSPLV